MLFKITNVSKPFVKLAGVLPLLILSLHGQAQATQSFQEIPLNDLSAFKNPGANWIVSSDAQADYQLKENLTAIKGAGALTNLPDKQNKSHLVTLQEWGDVELELDFMMAQGSNAGVYLQGRYEIQLFDSWTKINPTASDCGGIYFRWLDGKGTYEGSAPIVNACKAPGLWQHLQIRFRAPRFDASGKKTNNARFEEVYLNGVLVQDEVEITGPTRSPLFSDEQPKGPVMIQGDHGPVAIKNFHYKEIEGSVKPIRTLAYSASTNPILIDPTGQPYILRSFVMHNDKKITHAISTGYPEQLNYSYDVKKGALFQVWRGNYLDVTEMWTQRGQPQTAYPRGSVLTLSAAPALSVLSQPNEAWPDSIGFYDLKEEGYTLTAQRSPVFRYKYNGVTVTDSIAPAAKAGGLMRKLSVDNASNNTYIRLAVAELLEKITDDLYAVGGKSYYLKVPASMGAFIRQSGNQQELLVKYNGTPVQYSIIW